MTEEKPVLFSGENVLDATVDGIDEALIVYDRDFTVSLFNKRAEELFKIRSADILGVQFSLDIAQKPEWKLLSPIIYSSLAPIVVRLSDAGGYPQIVKVITDDPHREFIVFTNQITGADGASLGFVKLVRDTTRESTLVQSKNDFITIAAHQLRTPATAVNWTFENLEKDGSLGAEAQFAVRAGHGAAQNLLSIINNLLNAAQVEEGRFGYAFQPVDMVSFLDKILADAMLIAHQYKVNIYFERPPAASTVIVSADAAKLALAVANIIDNGIKYNIPEGQVVVRLAIENGTAHSSITDTGLGIPQADMPHIFEKFFRAENTKTAGSEGSGLGLYLAKNIIEGHKGKVWVESVVGRGSTFHFTLPLVSSSQDDN